jgi:hypothetical protein
MSLRLAQSGHPDTVDPCLLLGVKRTFTQSIDAAFSDIHIFFMPLPRAHSGFFMASDAILCTGIAALLPNAREIV